jgi:hypothetical protein
MDSRLRMEVEMKIEMKPRMNSQMTAFMTTALALGFQTEQIADLKKCYTYCFHYV